MERLVSILIPCFDASKWIEAAIDSALGQSWPNKEVWVVDDGSSDDSLSRIESYGPAVRWESGPRRGGNAARNRLLELARGEWLQYLDADDYLREGKIAGQMEFARRHPGADVILGPWTLEYSEDRGAKQVELVLDPERDYWEHLARWHLPQTGAPLWRREAIIDTGGWAEELESCQDFDLYFRLLKAGKRFEYCASGGAVYRQWSNGTVSNLRVGRTLEQRVAITLAARSYLAASGNLTPGRRAAVGQGLFEAARAAWPGDPALARRIVRDLRRIDPEFRPIGRSAPRAYRWLYSLVGFEVTERFARLRRRMARPSDTEGERANG